MDGSLRRFIEQADAAGYPIRTLVAFSGTVRNDEAPGVTWTEEQMNGDVRATELPERFATQDHQVLLVAEKYQTGFDQPFLHTMYVDRRLAGIRAVQALSRLNRAHPLKEDTFILDFVNDREEIREAFKTCYEGADMGEEADPARMYAIKAELDASEVRLGVETQRHRPKQARCLASDAGTCDAVKAHSGHKPETGATPRLRGVRLGLSAPGRPGRPSPGRFWRRPPGALRAAPDSLKTRRR